MRMKSYLCNKCNSRFISNVNLNAHLQTHVEKAFICPFLDCNKSFEMKENMVFHYTEAHKTATNVNKITANDMNNFSNIINNRLSNNMSNYQFLQQENANLLYNGIYFFKF